MKNKSNKLKTFQLKYEGMFTEYFTQVGVCPDQVADDALKSRTHHKFSAEKSEIKAFYIYKVNSYSKLYVYK